MVMASDSIDLFGCPYCGFRVRPDEEACPRCGNAFKDDTKFECPFCGDMVSPGVQECPSCHINFTEFLTHTQKKVNTDSIDSLLMDIINLESSQIKKEERKFSCPKCSWMLEGNEESCPKCGADFREDEALQCPICGAFVRTNSSTCTECGTLFAGEEGADEEKSAEDHKAMSSALSDILTSAEHEIPQPEIENAFPEPPPVEESPPLDASPAREPVREPPQEPVAEPANEPVPEPEPVKEPKPEPQKAAPAAGPKKTKQRKLKAKPGPAKTAK